MLINLTHEIDLATILEGESVEVDFTVDLTERDGVDEGSVNILSRNPDMVIADTGRLQRRLGDAIREEIIRLMNGDELIEAARVRAAERLDNSSDDLEGNDGR